MDYSLRVNIAKQRDGFFPEPLAHKSGDALGYIVSLLCGAVSCKNSDGGPGIQVVFILCLVGFSVHFGNLGMR